MDSLLSKKESPKKGKKCPSASQSQLPSGKDKGSSREKKVGAPEPQKPPVVRRLLPSNYEDEQDRKGLYVNSCNLYSSKILICRNKNIFVLSTVGKGES